MKDLGSLGIRSDDVLLVHSSLKSLSKDRVEASFVIEALQDHLSGGGTLLMPALSYVTVTSSAPVFSVRNTPSCVGALSEAFRKTEDVVRSVHPTHSVCAWGRFSQEITSAHIQDRTPVGKHSPFSLLPEYGGKILFLGCGTEPNTSMHGVEELSETPYLFNSEQTMFIIEDDGGIRHQAWHRTHDFKGFRQRYDRLLDHLSGSEVRYGKIMEADCFVMDANAVRSKGSAVLREDPFAFVERI